MDEILALLRRYAKAGWRSRWIAVGLAWLVCLGGWTAVSLLPDQYEANARLYVDSDAVLTPLLRGLALDNTPMNQVEVLQRTLLSRPNLEKLISSTSLDLSVSSPSDREDLVKKLTSEIKVTPQTKSLFTISYRNSNAKLAYDVVQAILAIFVESKIGGSRNDMENARQFLQQQLALYERQLQQAEARRAEFRSKYIDLLPSDGGVSRLEMARAQVNALEGQLTDLKAKRDLLKRELVTIPPTLSLDSDGSPEVPGAPPGSRSNPELLRAELALADLRLRYTEQHPDVNAARRRVEQLRSSGLGGVPAAVAVARARGRTMANPIYDHLKVQLLDTEATLGSLQRQVADGTQERDRLEAIARNTPGIQAEFGNLTRDYDVVHKQYTELLTRREAMRLAAAADADAEKVKLQVIDPPLVPQNPIGPKRLLLVTGVLGMGLAVGGGVAVLLQSFDRSFHSIDELLVFGLPVAGGITLTSEPVPLRRQVFAVVPFAAALLVLCAAYGGVVLRLRGII